MQVELAQLRYRLPRLRGRGIAAQPAGRAASAPAVPVRPSSRSTAGASSAGSRSSSATSTGSARTRATQRKARRRRALTTVALVGYTNAGKSTLLNRLTHADVLVEDRLFSTLDPTHPPAAAARRRDRAALRHRRVRAAPAAPARRGVPVDARGGGRRRPARARRRRRRARAPRLQIAAVRVGARARSAPIDVPELLVFNKTDIVDRDDRRPACSRRTAGSVAVSGRDRRRRRRRSPAAIGDRLRALERVVELAVPVRPRRRARRAAPRRRGARRGARGRRHPRAGPAAPTTAVHRVRRTFVVDGPG